MGAFIPSDDPGGLPLRSCFLQGWGILSLASTSTVNPAAALGPLVPWLLNFCTVTSELYPFVFFSLRDHSNKCAHSPNTSTNVVIDK